MSILLLITLARLSGTVSPIAWTVNHDRSHAVMYDLMNAYLDCYLTGQRLKCVLPPERKQSLDVFHFWASEDAKLIPAKACQVSYR